MQRRWQRSCSLLNLALLVTSRHVQARSIFNETRHAHLRSAAEMDGGAPTAGSSGPASTVQCTGGEAPLIDTEQLDDWGCIVLENVCLDQGRFIVDSAVVRPGRTFWSDDLYDITQVIPGTNGNGPFYNVPGYLDNFRGAKKAYRKPYFRVKSPQDPPDMRGDPYDDCSVPLVWWPWWPFNPGDFFLASVVQLHAMQTKGFIDRNVRFTPVLDGLEPPAYVDWYLKPFTNHKVQTLEQLSDRSNAGGRCFKRLLLCKPYSVWNRRPGHEWTYQLEFGTVGQQIVEYHSGQLTPLHKDEGVFRIGWIKRQHKRRIRDFDDVIAQCNTWQAPPGTGFARVECQSLDFDDPENYLENLSQLQALDVLVGMHGAGLIHHNFMRPNTAFVEIVPCAFGGPWNDNSFQVPARQQNMQFAFKIQCYSQEYCWPAEWERADRRPDISTEDWVPSSLKRDQDVALNLAVVQDVLGRIVALKGSRAMYEDTLLKSPDYMTIPQ